MDEFLPSEMLAKIASYVSYKDVNSLLQTSKTAQAKLAPYRNILPKIPLCIEIIGDENELDLMLKWHTFSNAIRTAYLTDLSDNDTDELSVEQMWARVLRFYKGGRGTPQNESTFPGRLGGLSLHLQAIATLATMDALQLKYFDDELLCEELVRQIKHSRPIIETLEIESNNFGQCHLDVITACKPRCLKVTGNRLPDEFYRLPAVVQTVEVLEDLTEEKTVSNLFSLSANRIEIEGEHNISSGDIWHLMSQWSESKIKLGMMKFEFTETLKEEDCMELLKRLDSRLVDVYEEENARFDWFVWRRSDDPGIKYDAYLRFLCSYSKYLFLDAGKCYEPGSRLVGPPKV